MKKRLLILALAALCIAASRKHDANAEVSGGVWMGVDPCNDIKRLAGWDSGWPCTLTITHVHCSPKPNDAGELVLYSLDGGWEWGCE